MYRLIGLTFLFIICTSNLLAQSIIKGKVVDAYTLEPLPAAHIIIKGTYQGTIAMQMVNIH